MTLTQLYYFNAAAKQLNFHRTAEQLMISQPSLSASISSLEEELGVKLFQRRGRHVELSKQGMLYQREIDGILGRLDAVNDRMRRAALPGQGRIDLGYIAPLSPKFVPEQVRAFLREPGFEEVTFNFQETLTRDLLEGLKRYRHDVVFCIYEEGEPDVEFVPILEQELVAIVPGDHPLAREGSIDLSQLAPYPFITYMSHTRLYREILDYIALSGWTPKVLCSASTEASIAGLVANGFGVAVVARSSSLEYSGVRILHLKGRAYQRRIYMAYRKWEEPLPAVAAFIQFIRRQSNIT